MVRFVNLVYNRKWWGKFFGRDLLGLFGRGRLRGSFCAFLSGPFASAFASSLSCSGGAPTSSFAWSTEPFRKLGRLGWTLDLHLDSKCLLEQPKPERGSPLGFLGTLELLGLQEKILSGARISKAEALNVALPSDLRRCWSKGPSSPVRNLLDPRTLPVGTDL